MDDVKQMSVRADPTTTENKQEKKKKKAFIALLSFFLKENIKILQSKLKLLTCHYNISFLQQHVCRQGSVENLWRKKPAFSSLVKPG